MKLRKAIPPLLNIYFSIMIIVFSSVPVYAGGGREKAKPENTGAEKEFMDISNEKTETAVLAGGCFWCMEAVFERINGVISVTSGYSGGDVPNPSYEDVCTGTTGYAEAVKIIYNPEIVSFKELLNEFWRAHDPTTLNKQGADIGTQYRSEIFYKNKDQKEEAEKSIRDLEKSGKYSMPIVTKIEPLRVFYPAEDYHQNYFDKHPFAGYCRVVINPKLEKLGLDKKKSVEFK